MKKLEYASKILRVIATLLLIAITIFFTGSYQSLPDQIAFGQVNDSLIRGSKMYFVGLLWMAILSYGIFFALQRFPSLTPYPVKITPDNYVRQHAYSQFFLSVFSCIVMAMFFMIILLLYYRTKHIAEDFRLYLIIVFALFVLLAAAVCLYILSAKRAERRGNH